MKRLMMVLMLVGGIACSRATRSAIGAWGQEHCIRFYGCDGHEIARWTSTGMIENEPHSNGYFFQDKGTGKIVMVDGTFTATIGACEERPPQ